MNILEAQFTTEQAAGASGAGFENLQNWMKRGKVAGMERIAGGGAKGRHRRFSFHSVMEIAVVVDLRRVGYSDLDHAFRAATTFAHFAGPDFNVSKERWPGCPWSGPGKTLLMIGPDSYSIEYVDLAA
ncbi:MAG TPA: hypothetical protein PKD10_16180, partial [Paracoccaceae bacterium]|nr:hypothetical protein [Paracoccaceae bacterium]